MMMPELPSDPVQMMALLGDLNTWLTRVVGAYENATPDEKSVIATEVRAMLSDHSSPDGDLVDWTARDPLLGWMWIGFPCQGRATLPLDEVVNGIEGRLAHSP
jgi:hypothetical protein